MKSWRVPDKPPRQPGCLVVPSYALKNASEPTLPTKAALELAVQWWQRFPDASIIVSTGDNQRLGVTNAAIMAGFVIGLGVPENRVIQEDRSRNTFENLMRCRKIVQVAEFQQPTLVTHDLYTRRVVAIASKMEWCDLWWVSAFSGGEPAAGWKYFQTHSRLTILCYEIAATFYCRWKGWV